MARAQLHGGGGAGDVEAFGAGSLSLDALAQGVDFVGGKRLQFVDCHADSAFLVGGDAAEFNEQGGDDAFLAEVFDAEGLHLGGVAGGEGFNFRLQ